MSALAHHCARLLLPICVLTHLDSGCSVINLLISMVVLFELQITFGLGRGGMERLSGYPQTLWLILFGLYMTTVRVRAAMTRAQR